MNDKDRMQALYDQLKEELWNASSPEYRAIIEETMGRLYASITGRNR